MLINLMRKKKWIVTIFSPEQAPATRYGSTLVKQWLEKPFDKGPTPRMTEDEMDGGIDALQDRVTLLWPEEEEPTIAYLLEKARQEVFRRGIDGFVIDPWDEVSHVIGNDGREDLYIGRSLTQIRRFARTYNVHVWIVAHPRQFVSSTDAPSGYDISGGAKWRNKADNILSLRRDLSGPKESILEIHTAKIRFREDGKIGRQANLSFDWVTETYSDLKPADDRMMAS
jgi:twinkle protein